MGTFEFKHKIFTKGLEPYCLPAKKMNIYPHKGSLNLFLKEIKHKSNNLNF